jgi:GNAT superfamily N-acetyltransferase
MRIVHLTGDHDRRAFDCGREELNQWLREVARQHQEKGLSRTFVAVSDAAPLEIRGYYALAVSELDNQHLPDPHRRRLPRRIPGIRLGRLAVDRRCQAKGLGELLLVDAITRVRRIQQEAGIAGLFVDALDPSAAGFYQHFGFLASPGNPLMLYLPLP